MRRGSCNTEETKAKIRVTFLKKYALGFSPRFGRHHSEGTKAKMGLARLGKRHSEEYKANMSLIKRGHPVSEEARVKQSLAMKGKYLTEEAKAKIRLAHLGKHHSEGVKTKISKALKGRPLTEEHKANLSGKHRPREAKANISRAIKALWQDPTYADRQIKAMRLACHIKPNKPELQLLELLEANYPNEWAYVGDGQLIIGGKCPDFANINGRKQLIELYGDYWHKGEDPQERIDLFRQYGYGCLIVWESELVQSWKVIDRVASFANL